MIDLSSLPFTISSLHAAYATGTSPRDVVAECFRRIVEVNDPGIFIHQFTQEECEGAATALGSFDVSTKPLWGIPFVIKDNIDAAGAPTTAACPAYAYTPQNDAFVVKLLRDAGAILIGKTNLDQFATGLVGVRSPYQPPRNSIDPEIVPGGSSSGSAVSVGHGFVSFSLGTDTAGSGRVPAALNNIVGLKPTLGTLSARGVVPACRTLDTVSVFAMTVEDAYSVFQVASVFDERDSFARLIPSAGLGSISTDMTIGIPCSQTIEFFGDTVQAAAFARDVASLNQMGARIVELDFQPFYDVAQMLYEGGWVAERYSVIEKLLKEQPDGVHPITRAIVGKAENFSATHAFRDRYKLADLKLAVEPVMAEVDALCVPTIPTFYSVADLEDDPVQPNSNFGTYTNFVNLLDMCGIAAPTGARSDGRPSSVTLLAEAGKDGFIASIASNLHQKAQSPLGATNWPLEPVEYEKPFLAADEIELLVCGAHMSGLPLNHQLTGLGGRFLRETQTGECYNLYSLAGGPPYRPGLVRAKRGRAIEVEIWALPKAAFGQFMEMVPAPLGIGTVTLKDGSVVKGFICEAAGLKDAVDITAMGSWRKYLSSNAA